MRLMSGQTVANPELSFRGDQAIESNEKQGFFRLAVDDKEKFFSFMNANTEVFNL